MMEIYVGTYKSQDVYVHVGNYDDVIRIELPSFLTVEMLRQRLEKIRDRDKWVAALRSGEWLQGDGHLHAEDRYCCLGVYCEIEGVSRYQPAGDDIYSYQFPNDERIDIPDLGWAAEHGFGENKEEAAPIIEILTEMNDNGVDFATIANFLEGKFHEKG